MAVRERVGEDVVVVGEVVMMVGVEVALLDVKDMALLSLAIDAEVVVLT